MKLTDNVYVETQFRGANVSFFNTENGIVMIDSPYKPSDAIKWRKEIEEKGKVKYIISTEYHQDHVAGNFFFNAPLICHDKTRDEILKIDLNQILKSFADVDPDCQQLIEKYEIIKPTITFSDHLSLYLGQHDIYLMHCPGHTMGQTVVFVPKERVVFTGDNMFGKVQTFLHNSEPFLWLESLKIIEALDVDYIVPGHGEICNKNSIKEQADYIEECLSTIQNAIDRGLTRDEIITKISLPTRYPVERGTEKNAGKFLQMSISRLYDSLSARKTL